MANRLFGTDGVRGVAGVYPLDARTVTRLGAALVCAVQADGSVPRLIVGRDTRESGEWLEQALARGIGARGATLTSAGIIPTPAIAYLTRAHGFDAGVVISASHNPYQDNGIKIFSGRGEKFSDGLESQIERMIADESWSVPDGPAVVERGDFIGDYIRHAREALPDPRPLGRVRVAIDCANGATATIAPRLFRELGFEVHVLGCAPDGRNINRDCGSTSPGALAQLIRSDGFRMGVAFDGDGDRAIFVDHRAAIVDGDAVMLICAKHLKAMGRLRGNAIVATVMSNIGLELALREAGIELIRCAVGDKNVTEEILRRDLSLGGEQSGHIIFSEHLFTGDGIVTALCLLRAMAETRRELADLASELVTYPQVLVNVPVQRKKSLDEVPEIAEAIARVERRLEGRGRILVRYSGTEPLLRVMIEGREQGTIEAWAEEIAATVRKNLG